VDIGPKTTVEAKLGLLDDLKKQAAQVQTQQNSQNKLRDEHLRAVESSMQRAFGYLSDLLRQLAVIKPGNALAYAVPGVGELKDLVFSESFIDFRRKRINEREYLERVDFYIKWTGAQNLAFERDMPAAIQKVRDALWGANIKFSEEEIRLNGKIAKVRFDIPSAIVVDVSIRADHENGLLLCSGKNLLRLGIDDFSVPAAELTETLLEEVAKSLLGQVSGLTRYRTVLPR
jgi:hypothetical protein